MTRRGVGVRALEFVQLLARRIRSHGLKQGCVYLRRTAVNGWLRHANRTKPARVECPICGWTGYEFLTIDCGAFTVPRAECPQCRGHERHRMLHLYLVRKQAEFFSRPGVVLHFAPEAHVRTLIDRKPALQCFSTDYAWYMVASHPGVAFQSDMQQMPIADDSFDAIFCLHVLEHVPDDRKGLREILRILKPGGAAYIMVPFMMGWPETVEFGAPDPTIFDHVRGYAPHDFMPRLEGFEVDEVTPSLFLSEDELSRYRIPHDSQVIFRCAKP